MTEKAGLTFRAIVDALERVRQMPRVPNAIRLNQRTKDVLTRHLQTIESDSSPLFGVSIYVQDILPDGVILTGWQTATGFELDSIYKIDIAKVQP